MIQHEKRVKHKFLLPWQHVRFQTPFILFWKYSFNYLTGKHFQTIAVKIVLECQCIREVSEIQLLPYWGVENEIIVFLINEGSNRECGYGNKIFYIL